MVTCNGWTGQAISVPKSCLLLRVDKDQVLRSGILDTSCVTSKHFHWSSTRLMQKFDIQDPSQGTLSRTKRWAEYQVPQRSCPAKPLHILQIIISATYVLKTGPVKFHVIRSPLNYFFNSCMDCFFTWKDNASPTHHK